MRFAVPGLALLMLALTLVPAEVWKAPAVDATYQGFDPHLVYVPKEDLRAVTVSSSAIGINAQPGSAPSAILATSPVQKFKASVAVTVVENQGAPTPFRIGLWSPRSSSAAYVVFGPAPDDQITALSAANTPGDISFPIGDVVTQTNLGRYELGRAYRVEFVLDKVAGLLTSRVAGGGAAPATSTVTSQQNPKLFADFALSLTAQVSAPTGSSRVTLQEYRFDLQHQRLWAVKIDDTRVHVVIDALALVGVVLLAVAAVQRRRSFSVWVSTIRQVKLGPRMLAATLGAVGVYLAGNALLFPLAGHPFDMRVEQLYAYVSRTYGVSQLYYLPNIVSIPKIWNGLPYQEAPFPYGPTAAYLFGGIGWLNSAVNGGATFSPDSTQLEYLIKAVNVLFGLADAVLIYWILRQIGAGQRWSVIAGAAWLFNPAVWFSMSIWGQTHVISLFFVLLAVLLAEKRMPVGAWLALAAACFTRPQMIVFGVLIGIVLLRKFPWPQTVSAVSWTVIVLFVALIPLTLATSPSLPIDIFLYTFRAHETVAPGTTVTAVSQDAYSVWPLVEYLTQGVTGFHAAFNPSKGAIVGPLTFKSLSQILTLSAVLVVAAYLWLRRRPVEEPGGYLPYVALGISGFLMLLFGLVATHFLLALPFLVLLRRWTGAVAYFYIVIIWTLTTFVTMYGDVGISIQAQDYPLFAKSAVTQFFVWLYTADRFITFGIVANICAVVWLGYLTLRSSTPQAATAS